MSVMHTAAPEAVEVVENALNDVLQDPEAAATADAGESGEASADTPEPAADGDAGTDAAPSDEQPAGQAPEAETSPPAQDDFARRFGIVEKSVTGKENRIPYSRVRKIIEKHEKDLSARLAKQYTDQYTPKIEDLSKRVQEYEERLAQVGQFEQVMANDPQGFLQMLSRLPAYKPLFDYLHKAAEVLPPEKLASGQTTPQTTPPSGQDEMPGPNKVLPDGSRVYDMEGLQALLDWQERRVTSRLTRQVEENLSQRLTPIERERQYQAYVQSLLPEIDKQIAEARTWPQFVEHEKEIVKAMQADSSLSLEGAYRKVVIPKLVAQNAQARTRVMAELRSRTASTAVPVNQAGATVPDEPQSTQEVVWRELRKQGLVR